MPEMSIDWNVDRDRAAFVEEAVGSLTADSPPAVAWRPYSSDIQAPNSGGRIFRISSPDIE